VSENVSENMQPRAKAQEEIFRANVNANIRSVVRYGLYPFLLVATLGFGWWVISSERDLSAAFAWVMGARFVILLGVEFMLPMKREWKMSWRSFGRDLMYITLNGGVSAIVRWLIVFFAITSAENSSGWLQDAPIVPSVILAALALEFFQYWFHRVSHEAKGPIGALLWRIHVAHHLPDRVYLLMHPVMHPFNMLISQAIIQGALLLVGASPEAIFLLNALMGLQGWVSHFNVEIHAGPLNYFLVGTELHRDHHSADPRESKNYGVLTPFWDLVFGTFHYHPGRAPARLGVEHPADYPDSAAIHKVMMLPLYDSTSK
jgi:sterol desaturase/sphingolipid hydroxylase (fatty acid hydroxylase superfamily)